MASMSGANAELEQLHAKLEHYEADLKSVKAKILSLEQQQPTDESREELKCFRNEKQSLLDLLKELQHEKNLLRRSAGAAAGTGVAGTAEAGPAVGAWRQVDGSMLVNKRRILYATIIVENDAVSPIRRCEIRALVDSGSTFELVIPRRKAEQLGLVERGRTTATGFGDKVSNMIVYRPALVKLPATVNGEEVVYKQADLVVAARDLPLVQQEESMSDFAGFRAQQVMLDDGAIHISPLSSPRSPTAVPEAILGLPGMAKLHLKLDAERSCLLPVVGGELVVAAVTSDAS